MRVHDKFEEYFASKLWEWIPPVYRQLDAEGDDRNQLRSMVEIVAQQAATLRRSQDRVWEDAFVEGCDDWAVPYLADLVATRLLPVAGNPSPPDDLEDFVSGVVLRKLRDPNARGRRVDTAKTVYYRRRKGTLRVLEELIGDIAGWEGTVVESFRRLARQRHGLDPEPPRGVLTGTPAGGIADLRRPLGAERTGGPFDEYHHTTDVRRHREPFGRYAIPKLAFHLYRLAAYPVDAAPAFRQGPGKYTVDPLGRSVPLFSVRDRQERWDDWKSAEPAELPAPIPCRLLGQAEYLSGASVEATMIERHGPFSDATLLALASIRGRRMPSESILRTLLQGLDGGSDLLSVARFRSLLELSLVSNCAKARLIPRSIKVVADGQLIGAERIVAADLEQWSEPPPGKRLAIDPVRGRLKFRGAPPNELQLLYHSGFSGPMGAGGYSRNSLSDPTDGQPTSHLGSAVAPSGVVEITDNGVVENPPETLGVEDLTLRASSMRRPIVRLASHDWVFTAAGVGQPRLEIEGLWIAGKGDLVLRGNFARVVLRNCTLDPGSETDAALPPVRLRIEGRVDDLIIERCVLGPIVRVGGAARLERLWLRDSILQSPRSDSLFKLLRTQVSARRVTLLGDIAAEQLDASETLILGTADITNQQAGCFRFSAAHVGSRLPHPFESHVLAAGVRPLNSRRFGDPAYGQLANGSPEFLQRGAENGSEIGSFSALAPTALRLDALKLKVDEYLPFGRIPIYIFET